MGSPPVQNPDERRRREAERIERAIFRVRLAEAFRRRAVIVWAIAGVLLAAGVLVAGGRYWGASVVADRVLLSGALIPERVSHGEWWRVLSGTLLHKSWQHLLLNIAGLVLIGRHVEVAFGRSGFVSLYVGASVAGAFGTMAAGHVVSVGASGAVFGLIGALVAVGLRLWRRLTPTLRRSLVGLPAVILLVLLVTGVLGNQRLSTTDVEAHFGGALAGLALGMVLPIRLRDSEGRGLLPGGVSPLASNLLLVVAVALGALVAGAAGKVVAQANQAPSLPAPTLRTVDVDGAAVSLPRGFRAGVWRAGVCEGRFVDAEWSLSTHRVACFELPLAGMLLVGRPGQLLTRDQGDYDAMTRAHKERRFVWRQDNVLLSPAGGDLLFVVLGHEAMLQAYATALQALLPAPDSVTLPMGVTAVDEGPTLRAMPLQPRGAR